MADPELARTFAFYGSLLLAKMGLMSPLTARQRIRKMVIFAADFCFQLQYHNFNYCFQVFANQEDIASGGTVTLADSDVERVRRAHQNDLENIPLFLLAGHFYLLTNPSSAVATNLIRAFTCLRFAHTFVYLNQVGLSIGINLLSALHIPFLLTGSTTSKGTFIPRRSGHHLLHDWRLCLPLHVN